MDTITTEYLNRADMWLLVTTLAYFLMNGAQIFETAVLIPKWSKDPPQSLRALQGPYAPDLKTFWIVAHSIHELTFIAAIVFSWQIADLRNALLIIFALHFLVRVWTIGYFAPKIMAFQKVDVNHPEAGLAKLVRRWRRLNYIRAGAFLILSAFMAVVYIQATKIAAGNKAISKREHMEARLSVITLGVDDMAAQKKFYKSVIGWQPVAENKDIVFFKLNGFLFSLFDRKSLAESSGVVAGGSGFIALTISQNVATKSQVEQLHKELKAQRVHILQKPSSTPFGGYYFTFEDPEHNVLEVAYNPYAPLDEKGDVITHKNIDDL